MARKLDRAAWLEERRRSLGGSDAAAVLGLNPYTTPYTLWADKTGRLPEQPDNEAMRQGRDLEQYVAERFMEASGKRVRRRREMIRNPRYPFAHANVDRWVSGESAGLECKTTSSLNLRRFRNGEFPDNYYCQCVHYLAVTGAERWFLAVLVLNKGFLIYQMTRRPEEKAPEWCEASLYVEDAEIEALMTEERKFWQGYVEADIPPPLDGLPATSETLTVIYAEGNAGESKDLFGRERTIKELLDLRRQIGVLEKQKELLEQMLKEELGTAEIGRCDRWEVRWKTMRRRSFDHQQLAKSLPDLDLSPYFKERQYRRFEIKEMGA